MLYRLMNKFVVPAFDNVCANHFLTCIQSIRKLEPEILTNIRPLHTQQRAQLILINSRNVSDSILYKRYTIEINVCLSYM